MSPQETQPAGTITASEAQASGCILVSGPYRPDEEDWMLRRAKADLERDGTVTAVLVWQRARADRGGYMGVAIWRRKAVVA